MKLINARNTSLLTTLATGVCCLPALVLLAFGIGSLTLGATLAHYHWWFLGAGIGMLTLSYWLFFREQKACARAQCRMRNRALTLIGLAIATAAVAAFTINSLAPLIAHADNCPVSASSGVQGRAIIPVEGMDLLLVRAASRGGAQESPGRTRGRSEHHGQGRTGDL